MVSPEDVLRGFESGADDYLPKPFELPILIARIKGLLRRRDWLQRQPARDIFEFSGRVIDFDNLELTSGERKLQLTLMEANLLRYLIAREGQVARVRSCWKKSGVFAKILIPARSTISSCVCAGISKTTHLCPGIY